MVGSLATSIWQARAEPFLHFERCRWLLARKSLMGSFIDLGTQAHTSFSPRSLCWAIQASKLCQTLFSSASDNMRLEKSMLSRSHSRQRHRLHPNFQWTTLLQPKSILMSNLKFKFAHFVQESSAVTINAAFFTQFCKESHMLTTRQKRERTRVYLL